MSISRAFDAPSTEPLPAAVAQSVQSSLWQRLKPKYRDRAGDLAWLLVRLAQPEHREHDEACEAIMARSSEDLADLLSVVCAAPRAPRNPSAAAMVRDVASVIETAIASAKLRGR